jgi:peroxisomal membrane protein 2
LNLVAGAQEAWTAYNSALEASPLVVKSVTACVILGAADLAGQALESQQKEGDDDLEVDIARTVRFAFFGLVLQAPWNHFYYNLLDGTIPPTEEPWTVTNGIKVAIDQFIQAPIFTVLIFAFLGLLEGKSVESIKNQLDEDYVDTMSANCKYFYFII